MIDTREAKRLLTALVHKVVDEVPMELPKWRYDGEEVKTPQDVAAILGIPVTEAQERLARVNQTKDVYTGPDSVPPKKRSKHPIVQRAGAIAYMRSRKRKKGKEHDC